MTAVQRLTVAWNSLSAQWLASPGLRLGLLAIATLLAVYGLLAGADEVERVRQGNADLKVGIERLTPMVRERSWTDRAEEARRQRDALEGMLWVGADAALVDAELQDWLRTTAGKWGVAIRELELVRGDVAARATRPSTRTVRVRLVTDLKTTSMLGFLSELSQSERLVLVDRLALRPASVPAIAEIELRILASAPRAGREGR